MRPSMSTAPTDEGLAVLASTRGAAQRTGSARRATGHAVPPAPDPATSSATSAAETSGGSAARAQPRRGARRAGSTASAHTAAVSAGGPARAAESEPPAAAARTCAKPASEPAGPSRGDDPDATADCDPGSVQQVPRPGPGHGSLAPAAVLEAAKLSPVGGTPRRVPPAACEAGVSATLSRNTKRSLFGGAEPAASVTTSAPTPPRPPSKEAVATRTSAPAEDGQACVGRADAVWQNGVADEAADADRKRHRSAGSWSGELGMYTREEQALMAKVRGTIADPQCFLELEGAYDVHELVGDGTFSRVFKAVCRATRQDVAVKRVYQTVHPDTILNEARYLQRLGGMCNVPKLLNVRYEPHSIATHTCTRTRARAHTHTHTHTMYIICL